MSVARGKITILESCGSTNIEAADSSAYGHGDAVIAIRQTAGRGQRGHKWSSVEGLNLTFSVVFTSTFLPVGRQFLLAEAVALAVTDTLASLGVEACIKWTNDIYVGDGKICGMLLEHSISDGHLARSIAGIGLNINQREFPPWVANPCSVASLTGCEHDIMEVFGKLYDNLWMRYGMLERGGLERIVEEYNTLLYRRGKPARYFIPDRGEVIGIIKEVEPDGTLRVEIDGEERGFLFREIEYIL